MIEKAKALTTWRMMKNWCSLPLGGVGEIGMNLGLYGYGRPGHRHWIMVDCGVTFPGPELPGVDLVSARYRLLAEQRRQT